MSGFTILARVLNISALHIHVVGDNFVITIARRGSGAGEATAHYNYLANGAVFVYRAPQGGRMNQEPDLVELQSAVAASFAEATRTGSGSSTALNGAPAARSIGELAQAAEQALELERQRAEQERKAKEEEERRAEERRQEKSRQRKQKKEKKEKKERKKEKKRKKERKEKREKEIRKARQSDTPRSSGSEDEPRKRHREESKLEEPRLPSAEQVEEERREVPLLEQREAYRDTIEDGDERTIEGRRFRVLHADDNGDCMYESVATLLRIDRTPTQLRQRARDILAHRAQTPEVQDAIRRIDRREYAQELELDALAEYYRVRFVVYIYDIAWTAEFQTVDVGGGDTYYLIQSIAHIRPLQRL